MAEIAAGAQAQSNGIEQVTQAVTEMDKVTQQNAASAEESSSAASELSGQAEELASMVAAFQLSGQARTNAAVAPRRTLSLPAPSRSPAPHKPVRSFQHATPAVPRGVRNDDALPAPGKVLKTPPTVVSRAEDAFPMEGPETLKDF